MQRLNKKTVTYLNIAVVGTEYV